MFKAPFMDLRDIPPLFFTFRGSWGNCSWNIWLKMLPYLLFSVLSHRLPNWKGKMSWEFSYDLITVEYFLNQLWVRHTATGLHVSWLSIAEQQTVLKFSGSNNHLIILWFCGPRFRQGSAGPVLCSAWLRGGFTQISGTWARQLEDWVPAGALYPLCGSSVLQEQVF